MIAGTMPLAPASLVGPLAIPAGIVGGIVLGLGRTILLLLSFALIGALWLGVGSLFYLLGSAVRSVLKVDRHANSLFQTVLTLLKPLVVFYAVDFVAIEFWHRPRSLRLLECFSGLPLLCFGSQYSLGVFSRRLPRR
jgi:hypothetical protein